MLGAGAPNKRQHPSYFFPALPGRVVSASLLTLVVTCRGRSVVGSMPHRVAPHIPAVSLPESSTNTAAVSNSMRSADNEEARVIKPLNSLADMHTESGAISF